MLIKGFFEKVGARSAFASLALLLGFVLGEALLHEEAYVEIGYALALFSVLGSAACVGYLLFFALGTDDGWVGSPSLFAGLARTLAAEGGSGGGEAWPLLVSLLFSPLCVLFAGLAGWVEA